MSHPLQLNLYSKPNCSLCDNLTADLEWLQRELDFTVVSHNINDDATLKEKFQYLVPVLEIGGTLYTDALSAPDGPAPTYLGMFRHNIEALSAALSS